MIYYLECTTEQSHKFYELTLDQSTVITRFGKIGTTGTQQSKTYTTIIEAEANLHKKLKEKQQKGYQLITLPTIAETPKSIQKSPALLLNLEQSEAFLIPILWQFNSHASSFGLAVEKEFCWLGNETGKILKFDHQGQNLAQVQLPNPVKCIVTDDIWVYVGCNNGKIYDMTGKFPYLAYEVEGNLDIFWLDIYDGMLGISDANGGLTKIDPEGEVLWTRLSQGKMGWMLCADRLGFYHGHSKGVTMYEAETGRQLWHQETVGKVLFGCQQGDFIYAATSGKKIYCFHKNGNLINIYDCESSVYACTVDDENKYVFASDSSGFIYCFSQSGQRLWKAKTGCGSALSIAYSSHQGDRLYLATNQGILACIDISLEAIKAAAGGKLPEILQVQTSTQPIQQQVTSLATSEEPKNTAQGILLECFRQGHKLRVRVLSEGYHQDWMVQFPYNLRTEGDRYLVPEIQAAKQGNFYRIHGEIKRLI